MGAGSASGSRGEPERNALLAALTVRVEITTNSYFQKRFIDTICRPPYCHVRESTVRNIQPCANDVIKVAPISLNSQLCAHLNDHSLIWRRRMSEPETPGALRPRV
jgi:hypothetical protein